MYVCLQVTAYEFMQAWLSLKGTRNLVGYADLIKQVPPKDLPKGKKTKQNKNKNTPLPMHT